MRSSDGAYERWVRGLPWSLYAECRTGKSNKAIEITGGPDEVTVRFWGPIGNHRRRSKQEPTWGWSEAIDHFESKTHRTRRDRYWDVEHEQPEIEEAQLPVSTGTTHAVDEIVEVVARASQGAQVAPPPKAEPPPSLDEEPLKKAPRPGYNEKGEPLNRWELLEWD
jgi:hypothetical protein